MSMAFGTEGNNKVLFLVAEASKDGLGDLDSRIVNGADSFEEVFTRCKLESELLFKLLRLFLPLCILEIDKAPRGKLLLS